jgi:glycosyltransferase involved in cell wall biosynthesis
MACGTPVVAANRAALPETCGDAALLVDPDDPDGIAAAVVRAATEAPVRSALREAGLRRARRYDWQQTALRADELLCRIAGAPPAARPPAGASPAAAQTPRRDST